MSLGPLLLGLSTFWILVHTANRVYLSRSDGPTLPAFATRRRRKGNTYVTVDRLHLRVETTCLNSVHDCFSQWSLRNTEFHRVLSAFYDLGTVACCVGALIALGLLAWTTWGLALQTFAGPGRGLPGLSSSHLAKRDFVHVEASASTTSGFGVRPIIPGVTVPMSHLPLMLLGVFIGQIVHELGHAAASALDQIYISSAGLSLLVLLPSAFVALPAPALAALNPRARLRIIAGGPFHNLCHYTALYAVRALGVLAALAPVLGVLCGYDDVSGEGRVVVGVDGASHLHAHIPPGGILTRLDDFRLDYAEAWDDFFAGAPTYQLHLGWCVPQSTLAAAPTTCCDATLAGVPSTLACFVGGANASVDPYTSDLLDEGGAACLDPLPLLGDPRSMRCVTNGGGVDAGGKAGLGVGVTAKRGAGGRTERGTEGAIDPAARSAIDPPPPCPLDTACVRPSPLAHLVRLWMRVPGGIVGEEEVVVWNGEREEVREAVQTTTWRPRLFFLPLGLPGAVEALLQYLELATLSLFLFNLLPLPMLDGEQFLRGLLDLALSNASPYDELDMAALERAEVGMSGAESGLAAGNRSDGGRRSGIGFGVRSGRWMGLSVGNDAQELERLKERIVKGATLATTALLGASVVLGLVQGMG